MVRRAVCGVKLPGYDSSERKSPLPDTNWLCGVRLTATFKLIRYQAIVHGNMTVLYTPAVHSLTGVLISRQQIIDSLTPIKTSGHAVLNESRDGTQKSRTFSPLGLSRPDIFPLTRFPSEHLPVDISITKDLGVQVQIIII